MISAPRVQVGLRLAGAGGQTIEQFSTEKTKYVSDTFCRTECFYRFIGTECFYRFILL